MKSSAAPVPGEMESRLCRRRGMKIKLSREDEAIKLLQLEHECKKAGRPDLIGNYRPEHLADLVHQFHVSKLVQCFLAAEQELLRVQSLYSKFSEPDVDTLFASLNCAVRGNDKRGAPILWYNSSLKVTRLESNIDLVLAHWSIMCRHSVATLFASLNCAVRGNDKRGAPILWYNSSLKVTRLESNIDLVLAHWSIMCRHSVAMRPPGVSYMILVSDERKRRPIQFKADEIVSLVQHDAKMFLPNYMSDCVYAVGGGWGTTTVLSILNKVAPSASFRCIAPESLLDIVANPSDIPSYFGLLGSTPLQPNNATLSNYRREIFESGKQNVKDWCNRSLPVEVGENKIVSESDGVSISTAPLLGAHRSSSLEESDFSSSVGPSRDWVEGEQLM
eukprot:CAMPEP_0198365714 /NCGR_PEP_ID=MMETSP1450-20131203/154314_1 /TAXON_ID=753684 ORGANISM="Madagascaria erythrocladiodes, Strain CCMP3234" /NCGR_SAMPLE_ID=MMETSP1450 /ASSEMBLY_ACC=CAM_ASM_001115 /LENGTH=389 /DNA_ID=CAMNT_0044073169 /DNA_START=255 /DNA_END=1424 /DNA_ORIENTATION=+